MSNLPVREIDEYRRKLIYDPLERYKRDLWVLETHEKVRKVKAGLMTAEEAWGPSMTSDDIREKYIESYYREHPEVPRKYRLPKGWQYVGEVDKQTRLGLDYCGNETRVEREVSTKESSS
jgi:hypothetical protein